MILNGNQRGGGLKLAAHLMNAHDNDHVEVHELRGFTSESLRGALQEADAVSKGTRCKQYLFSLSLNPPQSEHVPVADFEAAIEDVEERLGLQHQPRAIVFHEKNGRRHAHAVWSRIDVAKMKAVQLSFTHNRLREVSKDLFLQHGWRLPDGLRDRENRDPRSFTLAEWQQAKRRGEDARAIKRVFQEAWQISDTQAGFAHALEEKGYFLARGDRRGLVALDVAGEVYSVPRMLGLKAKQVREKLTNAKELNSVAETGAHIARSMRATFDRLQDELSAEQARETERLEAERKALIARQRQERARLKNYQIERRHAEVCKRQSRFRRALKGLWDRLSGEERRMRRRNEEEAWQSLLRERDQTDALIIEHLAERKRLKRAQGHAKQRHQAAQQELKQDRQAIAPDVAPTR